MAEASKVLDLAEPVGLILSGIMGHIADHAEARSIVARLLDALPSGSYLSLNDGTVTRHAGPAKNRAYEKAQRIYNRTGAIPYVLRAPEEIALFFDGLELVEPGIVPVPLWRPEAVSQAEYLDRRRAWIRIWQTTGSRSASSRCTR